MWRSVRGAPANSHDTESTLAAGIEDHVTHLKLHTSSGVCLKAQIERITVGKGLRG